MDTKESLNAIFNPKSVAVIGATADTSKWGYMFMNAIKVGGFQGKVYPVNPKAAEIGSILDYKVYPNLKEVPDEVDCAVVLVPARVVPSVFDEMVEKKVKGAVVITSGFSETGEEGAKLIQQVKDKAAGNFRFVGPNCMGVSSSVSKFSALMVPLISEKGEVAFISQSGGYGLQLFLRANALGVGMSKFVSSGNETDLKGWEYCKYFAEDPETKVLCMYIEGLKEGRKWYETVKEITKKKPLVVIKVGVTEAGSKAAASHTGSIAGSDKVYDAAFKQAGVIRASDATEMFDFVKGLLYCPLPKGPNIGIVSNSGGVAVETADRLIENGLNVPTLNQSAQEELKGVIPAFGNQKNPVDLTANLDVWKLGQAAEIVLKQPEIDGLITIGVGTAMIKTMFPDVDQETLLGLVKMIDNNLVSSYKKYEKPVVIIEPSADVEPESAKILEASRFPVYTTPERAADVMGIQYRRKQYLDKIRVSP
jgi:acyl-CoA synthetase (NDP forming)